MPEGPGPHPTPSQSQRLAADLDRLYQESLERNTRPPLPAGRSMRGGSILIRLRLIFCL